MTWLSRHRILIALGMVGFVVFSAVSGSRLFGQSPDPHFVLLADAWLHGRLDIDSKKKRGDDWAAVETAQLDDGSRVRGRKLHTRPVFAVAGGGEIAVRRIKRVEKKTYYVSFPPFPAVLMLPVAALGGHRGNDVLFTVMCAALILPLFFAVLRRTRAAGLSERSTGEDIWLVLTLAFGTVLFYSAVQGRVWYTAHVVGVALTLCYVLCAIEAKRPVLAGLCLGLATMTRVPLAFMFPLFVFEAWRVTADSGPAGPGGDRGSRVRAFAKPCVAFLIPIAAIAAIAMLHNHARFGDVLEFGHRYLEVRQKRQIEMTGLFSYQYLSRNLAVASALLPDFTTTAPYISISGHGMALWVTTPIVFLLLWPRCKTPLHRPLWLTVALVALPTLLYQNSGWFQFGYRFSLDYMPLLVLLLAIGGRPLGRVARALIIAGIIINLFGAITFARDYRYYRVDPGTYSAVIKH
ncbi:MAG: hypothetical protein MJE77_04960 [Proteobacteria bacterium]|nr:hypothetical protein [Pseudomonadota bacterium]